MLRIKKALIHSGSAVAQRPCPFKTGLDQSFIRSVLTGAL
jgi:hypothetical protein